MYKLCKTEQSAQRQRQLEQGLLQAMLEHRYEEISVSDLCEMLQIPRKSFYRYFSSKDGALYALLDHTMLEFFCTGIGMDRMRFESREEELRQFFLFWKRQKKLLDALLHNGLSGILVERAMDLSQREGLMLWYIQVMEPHIRQLAMSFMVCGLLSMVIRWHSQGFATSTEDMTKIATVLLTKPLLQ